MLKFFSTIPCLHLLLFMNKLSMQCRGGSRIFFRRGCTRLLLYFNTNKPHSFFFFGRIPVVLENCRSSQGGGGMHPLHPPPRSAPAMLYKVFFFSGDKYLMPGHHLMILIHHKATLKDIELRALCFA